MMDVDEADETIRLGDVRYISLMRYLFTSRLVEKQKLISAYKSIFPQDSTAEQFNNALETINELLQNAKMEVKEVTCEVSARPCFVVVSTIYRPDKIWPSHRAEEELEFIKRVIHEIMISGRGLVTYDQCLNLNVKLSNSDRKDLIETLIAENWFTEVKKSTLTMSAACSTELEPYLKINYRDILNKCSLCKRTVYFGESCSSCNALVHRLCLRQYLKSHKKCSSCGKNWPHQKLGEDIDEMDCDESC